MRSIAWSVSSGSKTELWIVLLIAAGAARYLQLLRRKFLQGALFPLLHPGGERDMVTANKQMLDDLHRVRFR